MEKPKSCKDCPFSDHEAWCLIPGDWRERYYCPDDKVSKACPIKDWDSVSEMERAVRDGTALKEKR